MNEEIAKALVDVMVPIVTALAVAAGGWIAARLPGPIKDSLYSAVHKRDVELLLGAMARRATAQVSADVFTGQGTGDLIRYVRTELPGLVAKLNLSETALETIAGATLTKIQAELSGAAAPSVLLAPDGAARV